MKKLSLLNLLETDVLQKNDKLKFVIIQQIPKFYQTIISNLKADKYQAVFQNLEQLEAAIRFAKEQLKLTMSQRGDDVNQKEGSGELHISNKEV